MIEAAAKTLAAMAVGVVFVLALRYFEKPRRRRDGGSGDGSIDFSAGDSSDTHHGGWFGHGGDSSHGGDGGGHGGGGDGGGDGGGGDGGGDGGGGDGGGGD